jgi:hypothetical protein
VAFTSAASNLVALDTNVAYDVFLHDRTTGVTTRASVSAAGAQGNVGSWYVSIAPDGRHVAFASSASNLVALDTNSRMDVFLTEVGAPDIAPPHTTSTAVANYATSATINLGATDDVGGSGVAHTYYRLNGAAQIEGTTITQSTPGPYSLKFWSVDVAGNVETPHTVGFTIVTPPATNGTPSTPGSIATLAHGRSFTVLGYVIKHTAGTTAVTLQFYRYESGKWVLKKSVAAKASTILTFSKYSASTFVPYTGSWRVRAQHKVGTTYRSSGYRTFTAS